MRSSELGQKEIINLDNGARLGLFSDADIIFDRKNGRIQSIMVREKRFTFKLLGIEDNALEIPWTAIKKIGHDMIIVELNK